MASQELFQIVSSGKTLRSLTTDRVLADAMKAFGIAQAQARRLLLKGWVIRDKMTSREVIGYQSRLQKIGLRVEVFPAGKYSNEAMLARIRYAQRRKESGKETSAKGDSQDTGAPQAANIDSSAPSQSPAEPKVVAATPLKREKAAEPAGEQRDQSGPVEKVSQPSAKSGSDSTARAQIAALFSRQPAHPTVGSTADRLQLFGAMLPALLIPLVLFGLLLIAISNILMAGQELVAVTIASGFQLTSAVGFALSLLLSALVVMFLPLPFILAAKLNHVDAEERGQQRELQRKEAPGVFLLLDKLCERLGLPVVTSVRLLSTATVSVSDRQLRDALGKNVNVQLGLGAVTALGGRELMALFAHALTTCGSRLQRVCHWLVFETDRRLQLIPEALDSEAIALGADGDSSTHSGATHLPMGVFKVLGRAVVPVFERLGQLHRTLAAPSAQRLQGIADRSVARVIGSEQVAGFALQWQQMAHAALVVREVEREAAVAGQCLENVPFAIRQVLSSLDEETRSNIEESMAMPNDVWDRDQGMDGQRASLAEAMGEPAQLSAEFSVHKLFADLPGLAREMSVSVEGGLTPVPNDQLLSNNSGLADARAAIHEYFNGVVPKDYLGLTLPVGEQFDGLDLQGCIDWLRGGLVDLREQLVRIEDLESRTAIQLIGRSLIRAHQSVDARTYLLSGDTVTAADESQRDTQAQLDVIRQQSERVFSVFALRIERVIQEMPPAQKMSARSSWERLQAYLPLATRLRKARHFGDALSAALDRGAMDDGARPVIDKICQMLAQELVAALGHVEHCALLRSAGLAETVSSRVGDSLKEFVSLPPGRRKATAVVEDLVRRCTSLWMAVWNSYEVELGDLMRLCMDHEQSIKVRPLRLAAPFPVQEAS